MTRGTLIGYSKETARAYGILLAINYLAYL